MATKIEKTEKIETVEFYARYKGLGIMFKRPVSRPDGTTDPGYEVKFHNHVFATADPVVIEFLKERTIEGQKTIGNDYWLTDEMEKHVKKVPADERNAAVVKMKDDKISKLEALLRAEREKNEKVGR